MTGSALRVLNRGPWTPQEDMLLKKYIEANGVGRWSTLPQKAGLMRAGKSCRLRWMNHLRPNVKRGNISPDEEDLIIRLHKLLGNRWSLIAGRMPGRTDNEVKNYWNTHLSKKLGSTGTVRRRGRGIVKGQPLSCGDRHKSRAQTIIHSKSRSKIQTNMNIVAPENNNSFDLCPLSPTDSMAIPLHVKQESSKDLSDNQLLGVTEPTSTDWGKRDPALLMDDSKIGSAGESEGSLAPSLVDMNISYATMEEMADFLPLFGLEENNSKEFYSDSFASCWTWFDNLLSGNDFI